MWERVRHLDMIYEFGHLTISCAWLCQRGLSGLGLIYEHIICLQEVKPAGEWLRMYFANKICMKSWKSHLGRYKEIRRCLISRYESYCIVNEVYSYLPLTAIKGAVIALWGLKNEVFSYLTMTAYKGAVIALWGLKNGVYTYLPFISYKGAVIALWGLTNEVLWYLPVFLCAYASLVRLLPGGAYQTL